MSILLIFYFTTYAVRYILRIIFFLLLPRSFSVAALLSLAAADVRRFTCERTLYIFRSVFLLRAYLVSLMFCQVSLITSSYDFFLPFDIDISAKISV